MIVLCVLTSSIVVNVKAQDTLASTGDLNSYLQTVTLEILL